MKIILKPSYLISLLMVGVIFFSNPPWLFFGINIYFVALCVFLIILIININININFIYALPIYLLSILFFLVFKSYEQFRFSTILFFLTYIVLFYTSNDTKSLAFDLLAKILGYFICLSLFFWVIHNFIYPLSFGVALNYFGALGKGEGLFFTNYYFFIQLDHDLIRFYSVFDEPGVLGTLASLILLGSKYNFKKIENIFILIGGMLTFSLAFYIVTLYGYFFNLIIEKKYRESLIFLLIFSLIAPLLILSEAFNFLVVDRLKNIHESIDSRAGDSLDYFYNNFISTSKFFYGEPLNFFNNNPSLMGGQGYKYFVIEYGVIGVVLLFLLYIFLIDFKKVTPYLLLVLSCFIILFIQRPFMFTPWQILLFSMIVAHSLDKGR